MSDIIKLYTAMECLSNHETLIGFYLQSEKSDVILFLPLISLTVVSSRGGMSAART